MENNKKFRHEIKYLCNHIQLAVIQSRLKAIMKLDPHATMGQYTVRSMYFDDYENRCYTENESGVDPREKFRIRIYNSNDKRITLECKRKEKGKTHKTSCRITKFEFESILNGAPLYQAHCQSELLTKFITLTKTRLFTPSVIVEYERVPYVYTLGNVRITLDRNIRSSSDFSHFFEENIKTRQILPKGQHLLEVKYDEFLPEFIKEVLQLGELQQTTFSKFYLCKKYSMEEKS